MQKYGVVLSRLVIAGVSMSLVTPVHAARHRFTVRDSIEFATFQTPEGPDAIDTAVSFSPNGRHFIVVTQRGDLTSGKRLATIWLFHTRRVLQCVQLDTTCPRQGARALITVASASNGEPTSKPGSGQIVSGWRWSSDSRSVLFLEADDSGVEHLYRASLRGQLRMLSRPDQDVSDFAQQGGCVAYLGHKAIGAGDLYQAAGPSLPDAQDGTRGSLLSLLFPNAVREAFPWETENTLWVSRNNKPAAVHSIPDQRTGTHVVRLRDTDMVLSHDGRRLLVTRYVKRIPVLWKEYRGPRWNRSAFVAGKAGPGLVREFAIVDLDTGSISSLVSAPIDIESINLSTATGIWTTDGLRVAVVGSYPPLRSQGPPFRVAPCVIAVVDVKGRAFTCVQNAAALYPPNTPEPLRKAVVALRWRGDRTLEVGYVERAAPSEEYLVGYTETAGGFWRVRVQGARPVSARGVKVFVRQSLNSPPVLVAQIAGGQPRVLLDPNPQLKGIALGSASLYHWRDGRGVIWTGALVDPPEVAAGHRYPLVIQTHGLDPSQFLFDGPSHTAFAARALAGRGIVVLQVGDVAGIGPYIGTPAEISIGAASYRAAIRALGSTGLINPSRVGIIAWSHMGLEVARGLVDDPSAYKAAILADADDGSYSEVLSNVNYMGSSRERYLESLYGAPPWGSGLKDWMTESPGFRSDRVCTPIAFQMNSPTSLAYGWGFYAILRAQHKPVDLFYIRNGAHALVKPRERLVEQELAVDWFDYWLKGKRVRNPADPGEYGRWDAMRAHLPKCAGPAPALVAAPGQGG